jgi:hypothetical protein
MNRAWAFGFAKQAVSDIRAREALIAARIEHRCHELHFLQMAAEKLCKASILLDEILPVEKVQASHAYVGKHLPMLLMRAYEMKFPRARRNRAALNKLLKMFRHLAREVELLAPAVDQAGKRPDNVEYPWVAGEAVLAPCEYGFPALNLVKHPGPLFVQLLLQACALLLKDLGPTESLSERGKLFGSEWESLKN